MGNSPTIAIAVTITITATAAATATAATTTATATAATTAAAAAAAAAEAAAAAAATRSTLLSLIDRNAAAIQLGPIHLLHRVLCARRIGERHKSEAARTARVAVRHHSCVFHCTERLESRAQPLVIRVPTQTAYKQLIAHTLFTSLLVRAHKPTMTRFSVSHYRGFCRSGNRALVHLEKS
jgi:hypothetical protein